VGFGNPDKERGGKDKLPVRFVRAFRNKGENLLVGEAGVRVSLQGKKDVPADRGHCGGKLKGLTGGGDFQAADPVLMGIGPQRLQ